MNSESALAQLAERGLGFSPKPKYSVPPLPRDITDLGDEDLMDLFVQLTAWNDYLGAQYAVASIDEREAERAASVAEAQSMLKNWKGSSADRVAVTKAQVAADPVVVQLRQDHDSKHAYRKMIETLTQNVERDASLVSRELTRRTAGDNFKTRGRRFSV